DDLAGPQNVTGHAQATVDAHLTGQGNVGGVQGDCVVGDQQRAAGHLEADGATGQLAAVAAGLPVVDQRATAVEAPYLDVLAVVGWRAGIAVQARYEGALRRLTAGAEQCALLVQARRTPVAGLACRVAVPAHPGAGPAGAIGDPYPRCCQVDADHPTWND